MKRKRSALQEFRSNRPKDFEMKDRIRGWAWSLLVFKYRIQVIHLEFWNIVKAEPLFQNSIIVFLLLCDIDSRKSHTKLGTENKANVASASRALSLLFSHDGNCPSHKSHRCPDGSLLTYSRFRFDPSIHLSPNHMVTNKNFSTGRSAR